jgi:polar amino acid transport system permease protein
MKLAHIKTVNKIESDDSQVQDVAYAHQPLYWGRWLSWFVITLILAKFIYICANNPNFKWDIVASYLTSPSILNGLSVTLGISFIAMLIGVVLGLLFAIGRLSNNFLFRKLASLYVWFFLSTPLLVQLIFWYNLSALFPTIAISIPFGPTLASWDTNHIISPLTAAIIGLALNEGAYMTEIIRSGLTSVDPNQRETAMSFGMTSRQILFRIIIPQAMRTIIPPTGNQLISMIKATSMVSVIAMNDLLYSVQTIYNQNFHVIPLLIVAVIWYLVITSILSCLQFFIENYYARGKQNTHSAWYRKLSFSRFPLISMITKMGN